MKHPADTIEPEERLRVVNALNELSLDQRLVLTLHYMEGLNVPAMADNLDRSEKSVEALVTQARRELRATLDQGGSASRTGGAHDDDLEQLMCSIGGEDPSLDLVTSLRERVVAETSMPTVAADDNAVVEIDLRPDEREIMMTTRHWKLVGLAVAAIALIMGFVALRDDDGLETVGRDGKSTTSTVTSSARRASRCPRYFWAQTTWLTLLF